MYHRDRTFTIQPVGSAKRLAALLIGHTWPAATGFGYRSLLILNATEDTPGWAIVRIIAEDQRPTSRLIAGAYLEHWPVNDMSTAHIVTGLAVLQQAHTAEQTRLVLETSAANLALPCACHPEAPCPPAQLVARIFSRLENWRYLNRAWTDVTGDVAEAARFATPDEAKQVAAAGWSWTGHGGWEAWRAPEHHDSSADPSLDRGERWTQLAVP